MPNKTVGIFKYLLFSVIPCLVLILAAELGLRAYYYLKLGGYKYRIQKFVDLKSQGPYYDNREDWANELGFMGEGYCDPRKARNEYRILALGASAVAGTRESSWPATLEQRLNKAGLTKDVTVINGGIGGHTSSGEKKFLTHWIKLQPDLLIIYDLWNDLYYSHYLPQEYKEQFEISNSYYYPEFGERIKDHLYWHSILCRKISIYSKVIKKEIKRLRGKADATTEKETSLIPLIPNTLNTELLAQDAKATKDTKAFVGTFVWRHGEKKKRIDLDKPTDDNLSEIYQTNLNEMINLAKARGVKVMLIQQPDCLYHFTNHKDLFSEQDKKAIMSYVKPAVLLKDWIRTVNVLYPKAFSIMRSFENRDNVVGVYEINSVFDKYDDKREYWLETCHQSPLGRAVIGDYIAELILESGLIY